MADEVILEAGATIDVGPYQAGVAKMVETTQQGAAQVKAGFDSLATADAAVSKSVQNMAEKTAESFAHVKTGGIFAFDAVRAKMIEATVEVGRLRSEILQTDDPVALAKLRAQLREATAEMTAARTEMRALRFEAAEATEKANLLGEAMGVRLPGEIGKLLGRMPQIQAAMAAAFQFAVIVFFINMIEEAIVKIGEMASAIGGFGKAAEEAFEKQISYNNKLIEKNIELRDKLDEAHTIGREGASKYAAEVENVTRSSERWAERNREISKELGPINDKVEELRKKVSLGEIWISATEGLVNYKEELDKTEKKQQELTAEQQRITEKLQFDKAAESARRTAEERKRIFEEDLSNQRAATESEKTINTQFVDYYIAGVRRMFAENQLSLESEVEAERAAVEARLEIERNYIKQRNEELNKKASTGANVEPEREALQAQAISSEIKAKTELASIDEKYDRNRIDHANSVSKALAEASTKSAQESALAEETLARRQFETRKVSLEAETAQLKDALNKRLDAEKDLAQEELRIAQQRPYDNAARIITLNEQIKSIEEKRVNDTANLEEEAFRQKQERDRREQEEEIRFTRETSNLALEATRRSDEQRLKTHQITIVEWERSEREALERWYSVQRETYQRAASQAAALFGEQSIEYRRVVNEMTVLAQKFANENERVDQQVAAKFEQSMNVISRSFNSAFDKMLTEHTTFAKVMTDFWNQMVQGWARMGLQIVADYVQTLAKILIQEILTAAKINVIHTQQVSVKEATENAFDTFLNALGIKRTGQAAAEEARDTAVHHAGILQRQTSDAVAATTEQAYYESSFLRITQMEAAQTAQHTAGQTAQATATAASQATQTAAAESGSAARSSTGLIEDLKSIGRAAATAAAHAFKWVMEEVPFPANVALAPAAAAAAFAGVLAFKSLAVAEKGAFVSEDTSAFLHKNETVLPPPISLGLKNLIDVGGLNPPGGGGGDAAANTASFANLASSTASFAKLSAENFVGPGAIAPPTIAIGGEALGIGGTGGFASSAVDTGGLSVSVPGALSSPTPGFGGVSHSSTVTNKTVNVQPSITVHVNGKQHPDLTQSDIEAAVLRGIRKGSIRANV